MIAAEPQKCPLGFAISLIVFGIIGWIAAFALTLEKLHGLANPGAGASCDFSVLVQCTANLQSAQGSLFGFPNPILGLAGWMAPIVVGAALLAGARFDRWFWIAFNVGMALALALVVFLVITSIYFLGTLCPWCMVTWTVTIPGFLLVTARNAREGVFGDRLRSAGAAFYSWVAIASIVLYLVIAVLAQLRLDVLGSL